MVRAIPCAWILRTSDSVSNVDAVCVDDFKTIFTDALLCAKAAKIGSTESARETAASGREFLSDQLQAADVGMRADDRDVTSDVAHELVRRTEEEVASLFVSVHRL